ncbi:MAG: hypothetical protein HQK54_11600 [Oligoflexales bacterium]|nr:hypothetical protein [Oligoflexales bacterium]
MLRFVMMLHASIIMTALNILAEPAWESLPDQGDIKRYRQQIEGSGILSYRGVGIVNAKIPKIIALLADANNLPFWVFKCNYGELLEKNFETGDLDREFSEYYEVLYGTLSLPWPLKNRDFAMRANLLFMPTPKNRLPVVRIFAYAIQNKKRPQSENYVRMELMTVIFDLTPAAGDENTTNVDFSIRFDPGGAIPEWATNFILRTVPGMAIEKLREMVTREDYDHDFELMVEHFYRKRQILQRSETDGNPG